MLEQMILKRSAHEKVLSLKETRDGLDFHFSHRSHAIQFADFVTAHVPSKVKQSRHLVSHDVSNNIYNYKYTILCELCTVCVDDVVHIPRGSAITASLSGASPLLICHKVST